MRRDQPAESPAMRTRNGRNRATSEEIDFSRFRMLPDLPPHRQIAAYLKVLIALGKVSAGTPLPAASALAGRLKTRRAEVLRAYDELTQRGFLAEAGESAWTVSDEYVAADDDGELVKICDHIWDLILRGRQAGLSRAELRRMFERLLERS